MGRVGIPTKYMSHVVWRGDVVDYGVLVGSVEETTKKTENGKGRLGNVYQHTYIGEKSYPAGWPLARVALDVDVHIFNIQTKLKGV